MYFTGWIRIFCFKKNTEIKLTREHIIPQNVGGNLFIDEVCNICNNKLGQTVDIQILKYPEILDAFSVLDIPHDKSGILKNYFKITGKSENFEFPAIFHNGKYKILPQSMPDGSIIFPEEDYLNNLQKIVKRDDRLKSSKVPESFIDEEINKLKNNYSQAKIGDYIDGAAIGRKLFKRRDKFKIRIESKGNCEIERFVAKLYYEFLYFVQGIFIFERSIDLEPIIRLIDGGEKSNVYYFSRQKPKFKNAIPTHLMRLLFTNRYQHFYVSFFGILDFLFMTFYHYDNFWTNHEKIFKNKEIQGIHFEQNVHTGNKNFWFIDKMNKIVAIKPK